MKKLDTEMKRTDALLYQMIPKVVADRLRNGEQAMGTCQVSTILLLLFLPPPPTPALLLLLLLIFGEYFAIITCDINSITYW